MTESDGKPKVEHVAASSMFPSLVEMSPARNIRETPKGSRIVLDRPGLYRVGDDGILDTRTLGIHHVSWPNAAEQNPVQPLSVSPDERSFVRLVFVGNKSEPNLAVTDFILDKTELVRIDRARMRYNAKSDVDAAWVSHHFKWERGEDGFDHLAERSNFPVLPYRGDFELRDYGVWLYTLSSVKKELVIVIEEILQTKFGAEPHASKPDAVDHKFRLGGAEVSVHFSTEFSMQLEETYWYVMVWMDKEIGADHAARIAGALDAELATGRHDALFAASGA
jgi:hypothetical protein